MQLFRNFENHRIDVRGVMIKIKVQFEDSLEQIPSASTANAFSVLTLSDQPIALRAPAVHGVSSHKVIADQWNEQAR